MFNDLIVLVNVLSSSSMDHGLELQLDTTKEHNIGICWFSGDHAALSSKTAVCILNILCVMYNEATLNLNINNAIYKIEQMTLKEVTLNLNIKNTIYKIEQMTLKEVTLNFNIKNTIYKHRSVYLCFLYLNVYYVINVRQF